MIQSQSRSHRSYSWIFDHKVPTKTQKRAYHVLCCDVPLPGPRKGAVALLGLISLTLVFISLDATHDSRVNRRLITEEQQQLLEAKTKITKLEGYNKKLAKDLKASDKNCRKWKSENKKLRASQKSFQKQSSIMPKINMRIMKLITENRDLRAENKELRTKHNAAELQVQQFEAAWKHANARLRRSKVPNQSRPRRGSTGRLTNVTTENKALRKNHKAAEPQLKQFEVALTNLDEVANLKKELANLKKELVNLKKELHKAKSLAGQVRGLKKKLKAKNSGTEHVQFQKELSRVNNTLMQSQKQHGKDTGNI